MKTRLFVVLFCLVWALGCGNRDPEDVETGFGRLETVTLRICNNSNCVGGDFDGETCVDDFDCGAGGDDDPQCEIFVPLNECFGGSAAPRTPCETDLECGSACDAGALTGAFCMDDSDCQVCVDGVVLPGTQCTTADDCGGACLGGTFATDGAPCFSPLDCGGVCVGGDLNGRSCAKGNNSDQFCINGGGVCNLDGVSCNNTGECVQSGACIPGECSQVGEGCVNSAERVTFTGVWDSCLNLDSFLSGTTDPAEPMRMDGPPTEILVSACNSATLDLSFEFGGLPTPGCVGVEFTSGDQPNLEQCGETISMEIDFR